MKKGIIIYQSKYGATKKYVQWLQQMTDFDCIETRKASADALTYYKNVVLCGGIYASGIAGLSFLKENMSKLSSKKIAVFGVGASECDEQMRKELKARNLTGNLEEIPFFYGRGSWDEGKLKFPDKILCKMLRKAMAKKDPDTLEPSMETLMSIDGKSCDWTDEKYLYPLLEYLKC